MNKEWRDFLTEKEIEEVETIKVWIECAAAVKKLENSGNSFTRELRGAFPCSCQCMEEDSGDWGHDGTPESGMDTEIRQLLAGICRYSRRHGLCQCLYHQAARAVENWNENRKRENEYEPEKMAWEETTGEGFDEELPF